MVRRDLAVRRRDERDDDGGARRRGAMAYAGPWIGTALMVPAGWAAHAMWGEAGAATGIAAAGIAAAGGTVTYLSHRLAAARSWYAHHITTATTGAATVWLSGATLWGTGRPLVDLLLIGGATLAGISNVHTYLAATGGDEDDEDRQPTGKKKLPSWDKVAETLNIRGVRMRVTEQGEVQTKGRLTFSGGQTIEDLQGRRSELASLYKVAPGAVRITEHPERADWGEIAIITEDVMGQLIPWPGLKEEHRGLSIADAPLELGVYEDGTVFTDELDNRHTLTCGMSGAGKSVYGKCKIVQVAARKDTFVAAIDLSKGKQTLGPVAPAIGWPAYDKKAGKAMLRALKVAITARANHLGEQGLPGWTPDCGLTFLHVLIEEAADLVDFDELVELMRVARSVGVHFEISLQRASWGNLDTDARANLGDGICFGVRDEADARFALPDYVTEAGAEPHRWRKAKPGAAYAAIEHTDTDRHATPVKMYGPPTAKKEDENRDLAPAAASLEDQDAKLDPVTRAAFGAAYAEYLASRGAEAAAGPAPAATAMPAGPVDRDEGTEEMDDVEPIVLSEPDDDPEITGDLDTEIPELEVDFALAPPKKGSSASAGEARAALERLLEDWAAAGHSEFRAPQVGAGLLEEQGVQRSRAWVIGELRRLVEEGRLVHEDGGEYRHLQPQPA